MTELMVVTTFASHDYIDSEFQIPLCLLPLCHLSIATAMSNEVHTMLFKDFFKDFKRSENS